MFAFREYEYADASMSVRVFERTCMYVNTVGLFSMRKNVHWLPSEIEKCTLASLRGLPFVEDHLGKSTLTFELDSQVYSSDTPPPPEWGS